MVVGIWDSDSLCVLEEERACLYPSVACVLFVEFCIGKVWVYDVSGRMMG